ncbi:hypothetical protein DEU56DRAFT_57169 [Suillus clintonianus]|uniref:uncharacterized protein n=1 Tax=Suillus clintonianus TaxID=1904413 RepID=UPI001B878063|nr:uncharacterized protein DEU56DRAFT_57169 [Suillus clintonianus]KAG2149269.1 hypothetical protein DEU56DRAFT_57169 [Suillus clintonianus]
MLQFDLKIGPQADACLSGNLPVELTFRDNGPSVGSSRSVAKNMVSSKASAKAKGKTKAVSAYMPLYQDDDEVDPVSDFEPVKDAVDMRPTIAAEPPQDHSQIARHSKSASQTRTNQNHGRKQQFLASLFGVPTRMLHQQQLRAPKFKLGFLICVMLLVSMGHRSLLFAWMTYQCCTKHHMIDICITDYVSRKYSRFQDIDSSSKTPVTSPTIYRRRSI